MTSPDDLAHDEGMGHYPAAPGESTSEKKQREGKKFDEERRLVARST
jgi:hypothetical protein